MPRFWVFVCLSLVTHGLLLRSLTPDIPGGAHAALLSSGDAGDAGAVSLRFAVPRETGPVPAEVPAEAVQVQEPAASVALVQPGERDEPAAEEIRPEEARAEEIPPEVAGLSPEPAPEPALEPSDDPGEPAPAEPRMREALPGPRSVPSVAEQAAPPAPAAVPGEAAARLSRTEASREDLILGQGQAPSYARYVAPEYPDSLRRRGVAGMVQLRVLVGENGKAGQVEVLRSAHPQLSGPARESARRSTYNPLIRDGRPAACWVRVTMRFTLR